MASTNKTIVFPSEIVKAVEKEVEKEKLSGKNFSDFIREATIEKLKQSNPQIETIKSIKVKVKK